MSLVLGCPVVIRTNISPFKVSTQPRFQAEASSAAKMYFVQFKLCTRVLCLQRCVESTNRRTAVELRVSSLYRVDVRGKLCFVLIRSGRLKIFTFPVVP